MFWLLPTKLKFIQVYEINRGKKRQIYKRKEIPTSFNKNN